MNDTRGLVISCPIEVNGQKLRIKNFNLDINDLRFALLFWDKIDYPSNKNVHIGLDQDAQFLADSGILQRTSVDAPFGAGGDIIRHVHVEAFKSLDRKEPGTWSIATGANSVSFIDDDLEVGRGALVSLHRALPVPDRSVPLADILEFREKRRSELLALRTTLEDAYQKVADSADRDLALGTEITRLQQAVSDYLGSAKGLAWAFRLADLNASVNLVAASVAGITGFAAHLTLPATIGAMASASLAVNVGTSLKDAKATGTPYGYVAQYHDEVFVI